jgi:hypothetical protein
MDDTSSLPFADPAREEMAEQLFREYEFMSPEEWAARFAHTVLCSSFDDYRYHNPQLHQWIHRLHQILRHHYDQIDSYRLQYLSAEEREKIERESNEP